MEKGENTMRPLLPTENKMRVESLQRKNLGLKIAAARLVTFLFRCIQGVRLLQSLNQTGSVLGSARAVCLRPQPDGPGSCSRSHG